jgi:hypothetical protein
MRSIGTRSHAKAPATDPQSAPSGHATYRLAATLAGMTGRGEPRPQPIEMLPTIAHLMDEGLADTSEQHATLLEARSKPWELDDALVNRSTRQRRGA